MIVRLIYSLALLITVAGCDLLRAGDHPPQSNPQGPDFRDNVPMTHILQTDDWEELDHLGGINAPDRHIWIRDPGLQLRKKVAFIPLPSDPTPKCISYGGKLSIAVQTVEVLGKKGQAVQFLQGAGDCTQ